MDERFQAHRAELFGVAYRMLGTKVDAEDVMQEAWLRWRRVDSATVGNPRAYLFQLVANAAVDELRRLRARREEYIGPWLPEPLLDPYPEQLGESASVGLLVVLETLTANERAVFVLHEAFDFSHAEIGLMLGRSERAIRQLAYRARQRVRSGRPRQSYSPDEHRTLTERFVAAAVNGDVEALVTLLAPDAVLRADSNGQRETPREPLEGAEAITHWFLQATPFWPPSLGVHAVTVSGGAGALVFGGSELFLIFALELDETNRVVEINIQLNPRKLGRSATSHARCGRSRSDTDR